MGSRMPPHIIRTGQENLMIDCSVQAIELVSFSQNGRSKVKIIVLVRLRVIQNDDGDTKVRIINHYF